MEGGKIKRQISILYKKLFDSEICLAMGEADLKNGASETVKQRIDT